MYERKMADIHTSAIKDIRPRGVYPGVLKVYLSFHRNLSRNLMAAYQSGTYGSSVLSHKIRYGFVFMQFAAVTT